MGKDPESQDGGVGRASRDPGSWDGGVGQVGRDPESQNRGVGRVGRDTGSWDGGVGRWAGGLGLGVEVQGGQTGTRCLIFTVPVPRTAPVVSRLSVQTE